MYQSGCVPADTGGVVRSVVPDRVDREQRGDRERSPERMKKKPPIFDMYTGIIGNPTTLPFVRPGPANWVCLLTIISMRCSTRSATRIAGSSRMCRV